MEKTFKPGPNKKAQEVIFSGTTKKISHPPLNFSNTSVRKVQFQKHLGVYLDGKLDFREHLQNMFRKINKIISLLLKLQNNLPRAPLITIYKSFVRPHLDYGDILYDQTFHNSFHEKLKSIQYNPALAITDAVRDSSREKLYEELGFESLQQRRWYRKLCWFFKKKKHKNSDPLFNVKHNYFKNFFFPSTVIEWSKLDSNIRNSESLALFKKLLLAFIRPFGNRSFQYHNPKGLKLITRLQLGLSHLRFHKFKHSFQD